MFGFPSSMDSAENKTFFVYRLFFAHHFPAGSIYWENRICKGGVLMDPVFPHGDVDDLIYREEWAASDR